MDDEIMATGVSMIDKALSFVGKITGPPSEELGELLRDKVRWYRYKNLAKILNKADELTKEHEVYRKLPLKVVYPIFHDASLEEDESLQAMWASLLAASVVSEEPFDPILFYRQILRELSPLEVRILNELIGQLKADASVAGEKGYDHQKIMASLNISPRSYRLVILHLTELGLLEEPWGYRSITPEDPNEHDVIKEARLTSLGVEFFDYCHFEKSSS